MSFYNTYIALMSDIEELPPSSKLVYKVLEYQGALTQQELAKETRLSQRTVRDALTRLQEINAITETISFHNAQQKIYRLRETPIDADSESVVQ